MKAQGMTAEGRSRDKARPFMVGSEADVSDKKKGRV
jgi:hypothetical protein